MLSFPMQSTFRGQGNLIKLQTWVLIPPLILTGIVLRFSGFSFVSYDMQDFLLGWYDRFATDGFAAFREPFSNYAPLYLYLLCLITKTARFLPRVVAIKLLSIFFDLLNAALVYKILRIKYPQAATAWIGAACFLLLPIVLLNSSYWGQSDAIYACFVLGLAITAMIALTWVTLYARTVKESNPETILLCALVSVVFMPFFLPKMHDRYFYRAEVLSFLVAFYFPSKWFLAVGYQFVSGLVYSVVLIRDFIPIAPAFLGNIVILAALVNAALMVYIFRNQWTFTNGTRDAATQIQFLTPGALSNDS